MIFHGLTPHLDFGYHVPIIFVIDISQRDVASGHPRSTIYTVAPPGRMVNGWQVGNPNSSFHCWILVRSDRFHVEIQLVTKGSATMEPSSVAMQRTLTILNITSSCLMKRIILYNFDSRWQERMCLLWNLAHLCNMGHHVHRLRHSKGHSDNIYESMPILMHDEIGSLVPCLQVHNIGWVSCTSES